MLILPLHQPLDRRTFPLVTALLVLLNVLIFSLAQSGDTKRVFELQHWYENSGLATSEWTGYLHYLEEQGDLDKLEQARKLPEKMHGFRLFQERLLNVPLDKFLQNERQNRSTQNVEEAEQLEQEIRLTQEFDQRSNRITTLRYLQRNSEIDPVRMVTHAFLHGGLSHLIGNMLFLIALGLLVEGPLGEWRFALLYLVGTLGSAAFSMAWNWGDGGGGLGASGAIAALMGAFCILWGRRPVRFFWWFFVAFGYIKKPAIWLLPLWIGWEAFNLTFNSGAGIGFDAHLGGLLTGALAGWLLLNTGQLNEAFFIAGTPASDSADALQKIRLHMGRMQLEEAETRLDQLLQTDPQNFQARLLHYRLARLSNQPRLIQPRALALLRLPARNPEQVEQQFSLLKEAFPADQPRPGGAWLQLLRRRWTQLQQYAQAQSLLEHWLTDTATPGQWFELALARRDGGEREDFRKTLQHLDNNYPESPEAEKARFLMREAFPDA